MIHHNNSKFNYLQNQSSFQNFPTKNLYEILNKSFIEIIEPELKRKYNLVMPALYIKINENSYILSKTNLLKFFSLFGDVEYTDINKRHFYILYKFYFSAIFCFNTLIHAINKYGDFISVKMLENEKDFDVHEKDFSYSIFSFKSMIKSNVSDKSIVSNLDSPVSILKNNTNSSLNNIKHVTIYYLSNFHEFFNVGKKIIGAKGNTLKEILSKNNSINLVKIRLRGKGSKFIEPNTGQESSEPLQLCISSYNIDIMNKVNSDIEKLILNISCSYFNWCENKKIEVNYSNEEDYIVKYYYSIKKT